MADLVQTPADVSVYNTVTADIIPGISGEANINAGMPCYQTNADNARWFKASSANALTAGSVAGIRISMATAPGAGQPLQLMGAGQVNLGATLEVGETYVVSNTAGAIKPIGDLTTNEFTSIIGFAANNAACTIPPGGCPIANVARTTNVT